LGSLRHAGFRLQVFSNDHPPPHAHAFRGQAQVLVALLLDGRVKLLETRGELTRRDVRAAVAAVREQYNWLRAEWERIHGTT